MTRTLSAWATVLVIACGSPAQLPLVHYHFNEGGSPVTTTNVGTLGAGPNALVDCTLASTGSNGTPCLTGVGGAIGEVSTPLQLILGASPWTVGFAIRNGAAGGFQYVFSENLASAGFRVFTGGGAGPGAIRLAGTGIPNVDIAGGAGDAGWVHVTWVNVPGSNQIRAYLNGALVSTIAAPGVTLNSGNFVSVGRNQAISLLAGTLVDDFRFYNASLSTTQIASWADAALSATPSFDKAMLTEVSWVAPRGYEITNFSGGAADLTNWRLRWLNGATTVASDPIDVTIAPGESVVIMAAPPTDTIPLGTQVVNRFPAGVPATPGPFTVALVDAIGTIFDEVHVNDPASPATDSPEAGGKNRGLAVRTVGPGVRSVERIWGLDSDGGTDWTERVTRTLGRENSCDGARGSDPVPVLTVRINEIDDSPDYIELYNPGGAAVDLSGWFLRMSGTQLVAHGTEFLPGGTVIPPFGYVVLGDAAAAPAEIPGGVPYVEINAIPYGISEYDCALYDARGRLIDLVRSTGNTGTVVHNHPRAPSHWADFTGSAGRNLNGGASAIGRSQAGADNDAGSDWFPIYTRTMGSANLSTSQAGPAGFGDVLDVRLNATGLGAGFQAIINAGPSGNLTYNFVVSTVHSNGLGPILGLGPDVFANFATFYHVPPFWGLLNAAGSGRIEFDPGTLPPGVNADFIFFLQDGTGAIVRRTQVLEFDT
jgi:hypothetical protein